MFLTAMVVIVALSLSKQSVFYRMNEALDICKEAPLYLNPLVVVKNLENFKQNGI